MDKFQIFLEGGLVPPTKPILPATPNLIERAGHSIRYTEVNVLWAVSLVFTDEYFRSSYRGLCGYVS